MKDLNVTMFYLCLTVDLGQEHMFKLANQAIIELSNYSVLVTNNVSNLSYSTIELGT